MKKPDDFKLIERTWKNDLTTERTNFPRDFKKRSFFHSTNDFLNKLFENDSFLLNEWFYWMKDFTERSFSEKIKDDER